MSFTQERHKAPTPLERPRELVIACAAAEQCEFVAHYSVSGVCWYTAGDWVRACEID